MVVTSFIYTQNSIFASEVEKNTAISWTTSNEIISVKPDSAGDFHAAADFSIHNSSPSDLVIDSITASCGCIKVSNYQKVTPPGKTCTIQVAYKKHLIRNYEDLKLIVKSNLGTFPMFARIQAQRRFSIDKDVLEWRGSATEAQLAIVKYSGSLHNVSVQFFRVGEFECVEEKVDHSTIFLKFRPTSSESNLRSLVNIILRFQDGTTESLPLLLKKY